VHTDGQIDGQTAGPNQQNMVWKVFIDFKKSANKLTTLLLQINIIFAIKKKCFPFYFKAQCV